MNNKKNKKQQEQEKFNEFVKEIKEKNKELAKEKDIDQAILKAYNYLTKKF